MDARWCDMRYESKHALMQAIEEKINNSEDSELFIFMKLIRSLHLMGIKYNDLYVGTQKAIQKVLESQVVNLDLKQISYLIFS